jgi:general secretion pathway protein F
MPAFRYVAIDPAGKLARGVMEAADEGAVVARLQREGHIPMRAEPDRAGDGLAGLLAMELGGGALRAREVANLTRELSIMLGAGQDLDRALRFLVETAPAGRPGGIMGGIMGGITGGITGGNRLRGVLERIRDTVRDGGSLAAALAAHPGSFSRLYVGLVRAGEAGGALGPTLERLASLLERQRALSASIVSAMIYPGLLALAAIGSVTLLLTVVLPQFVPLFAQNGAKLPASTQMLIDAGDLVSRDGPYGLVAVLALLLAARQALKRPGLRLAVDRALLRLPVLGGLARETLAARFTRTLGTLLLNGVPLIAALGITRDAVGNRAAVAAIEAATLSARAGAGLSATLGAAGIFPPRAIHLLRLGEETAQLGAMALRAAEIHEEQARIGIQRLVSLLVPAITILMGALIAGIVSSLLLAMLSLNDLAS